MQAHELTFTACKENKINVLFVVTMTTVILSDHTSEQWDKNVVEIPGFSSNYVMAGLLLSGSPVVW